MNRWFFIHQSEHHFLSAIKENIIRLSNPSTLFFSANLFSSLRKFPFSSSSILSSSPLFDNYTKKYFSSNSTVEERRKDRQIRESEQNSHARQIDCERPVSLLFSHSRNTFLFDVSAFSFNPEISISVQKQIVSMNLQPAVLSPQQESRFSAALSRRFCPSAGLLFSLSKRFSLFQVRQWNGSIVLGEFRSRGTKTRTTSSENQARSSSLNRCLCFRFDRREETSNRGCFSDRIWARQSSGRHAPQFSWAINENFFERERFTLRRNIVHNQTQDRNKHVEI